MKKSMLLFTSEWFGAITFRMLPITMDCPYAEIMFIPQNKQLGIISKIEYEKFQMVPRLDESGERIPVKKGKQNQIDYKEERKTMRSLYEFRLTEYKEIENFIKDFAINAENFDFKKYMDAKIEIKSASGDAVSLPVETTNVTSVTDHPSTLTKVKD